MSGPAARAWCLNCGREAEDPIPSLDPTRVLVYCPDITEGQQTRRGCGRVAGTTDPAAVRVVSLRRTYERHLRRHGRRQEPGLSCPTCSELYESWATARA